MANRPIKKYRAGSIEACVWNNEKQLDKDTTINFKTVNLTRSWKDKDTWRNEVINLRKSDIQKVILVLNKAHEDIFLTDKEDEQ